MKIGLAHHWFVSIRGGEKVLREFLVLSRAETLHTLVNSLGKSSDFPFKRFRTSFLQFLPWGISRYRSLLPLHPLAVRRIEVSGFDLVLSTDAAMIKGINVPEGVPHVCYCHSPPRYLWEMQETYLSQSAGLFWFGRWVFKLITPYVREFDRKAAQKVSHFIANSHYVAKRIERCYNRKSVVIYPPVSVDDFEYKENKEEFYLVVSQLVPYKRIDIAIDAFTKSSRKLVVIGEGSELEYLKKKAGKTISFLGKQPFEVLVDRYSRAKGFIFPGIEDFGITPLEAMASGTPVIAYAKGGALETVIDGKTGEFFYEQSAEALNHALDKFEESTSVTPSRCREQAELFSPSVFRNKIKSFLRERYPTLFENYVFGDEKE